MRKDVREFIRRLEADGMPFTLPFSPDTIRWRRAAIVELRKLGIDL
jgi:hypothetical protein